MEIIDRLKNLSEADRRSVLESESVSIDEGLYTRNLTEDELLAFKETLAEKSVEQAQILDEFKTVKDSYKEKLKPIAKEISTALQAIKFKAIVASETTYINGSSRTVESNSY